MNPKRVLGKRMRLRRHELELAQSKVAELAGLDRTYYSAIERGERNPSLDNLLKIGWALEVEIADLLRDLKLTSPPRRAVRQPRAPAG